MNEYCFVILRTENVWHFTVAIVSPVPLLLDVKGFVP